MRGCLLFLLMLSGMVVHAQPLLRIGLIADPQYCDAPPAQDRYYRLSLDKISEAITTFNEEKVDFVVTLGDVIDRWPESFHAVNACYEALEAPNYHLMGNHEYWEVDNAIKASLPDSLGIGQPYCDIGLRGWRFIFLDGTELARYARAAHRDKSEEYAALWNKVQKKPNGKLWNGGIGQAQLDWLDERLAYAAYHEEQVVLFCHFPIAPIRHHMNLWNDGELRRHIRDRPNVHAWIAGHHHSGAYRNYNDLHYLTLRGMVMTADSNAYAILNVYPDRLEVEGFGREPTRVLPLRGSDVKAEHLCDVPPGKVVPVPPEPCVIRTFWSVHGHLVLRDEVPASAVDGLDFEVLPPGIYRMDVNAEGNSSYRIIGSVPGRTAEY